MTRSMRILGMAEAMGPDTLDNIQSIMLDVIDCVDVDSTSLHRLIRDSFSGDDDFDDLRLKIAPASLYR